MATIKELEKRIEELEARIRQLEARPITVPIVINPPAPQPNYPYYPSPWWQIPDVVCKPLDLPATRILCTGNNNFTDTNGTA